MYHTTTIFVGHLLNKIQHATPDIENNEMKDGKTSKNVFSGNIL